MSLRLTDRELEWIDPKPLPISSTLQLSDFSEEGRLLAVAQLKREIEAGRHEIERADRLAMRMG